MALRGFFENKPVPANWLFKSPFTDIAELLVCGSKTALICRWVPYLYA